MSEARRGWIAPDGTYVSPDKVDRAVNAHDDLVAALTEAQLQLVYLDSRFATGTTPAVVSCIDAALAKAAQP